MNASVIATGIDHPEGVAWDPRGYLVAGGEAGQVYRVQLDGTASEYATTGGFCLGIALDAAGSAYVCDMGRSAVIKVTTNGETSVHCSATEAGPLRVPNFPVFDDDGRLWVSDSGAWGSADGAIVVIEPDGHALVATDQVRQFPNGLTISPDGTWLYAVESSRPGVSRLRMDGPTLAAPEVVVELPGTVPDGLAFGAGGELLISCYRPDSILVWDGFEAATLYEDLTAMTIAAPTNLAFFGPELDRLANANLHGSFLSEIPVQFTGAPLRRPELN
ncbi:SMP-30/gluconolactonase/LRE family protein [soil metagenome]